MVLIASLVGLLLVEGLLRIFDYSRPPFFRYSETLGADHRPNTAGWYVKEDRVYVRINEQGLRGPDVALDKPDGVFRIAVLGDSYSEAFQVDFKERYSHVAERALNTCDPLGRRIEVLNFGVSGYGTAREILMYRPPSHGFTHPTWCFLLFTPHNDLRNNLRALENNPLLPYFELVEGALRLDDSFRRHPDFQRKLKWSNLRNDIVDRIRVLQVLQDFYVRAPWRGFFDRLQQAEAPDATAQPSGRKRSLATDPPETAHEQQAWAVTDAMLSLLRDETATAGQDFWISVVPPEIAIDRARGRSRTRLCRAARLCPGRTRIHRLRLAHGRALAPRRDDGSRRRPFRSFERPRWTLECRGACHCRQDDRRGALRGAIARRLERKAL